MALALADAAKWIVLGNKPLYSSLSNRHYSFGKQDIATQRLGLNYSAYSGKANRLRVTKRNLNRIKNLKRRYGANKKFIIPTNRRNLTTMIYV